MKVKFRLGEETGKHDKNGVQILVGDTLRESYYISRFIEEPMCGFEQELLPDGRILNTPVFNEIKVSVCEGIAPVGQWETFRQNDEFVVESLEGLHRKIFEIERIVVEEEIELAKSGGFFEVLG